MKFKSILCSLILGGCACVLPFTCHAETVPRQTARGLALAFLETLSSRLPAADALELVYTRPGAYYVFADGNCWVIVAADDRVVPILGYSTESVFYIPENEQDTLIGNNFWGQMKSYEDQIKYVVENNIPATSEIQDQWDELINPVMFKTMSWTTTAVLPLVTTTWDQVYPYNYFCPSGTVVGCVGVAMGQILKYHNWPSQGLGSYGYQWGSSPYTGADFGNTNYNFTSMPNSCTSINSVGDTAVARLLYHTAVSCRSMWGSNTGVAVTSNDNPMTAAFVNYFKCAFSTLQYIQKSDYTSIDWDSIIQSELLANRPVYYRGDGSLSHAWVCDGVDASNLYHFNWGWGGSYNGYFALSNLNPGSNNLSNNQAAIIGIKPNDGSTLVTNTTWSGTVTKTTKVAVPDAIILTVSPGAVISFGQDCNLQVWGTISSIGTSSNYAKLTAIDTINGWDGIDFDEDYLGRMTDNDTSKLIYTQVEWSKSSGIYSYSYGKIVVDHCKVNNNSSGLGAGLCIFHKPINISNCDIYNNHATIQGGGFLVTSTDTLSGNINQNDIHDNLADASGGGFYFFNVSYVTLEDNVSRQNQASAGAGGALMYGSPRVINNKFCNNSTITSSGKGGGLYLESCNANVVNNLFANNTAKSGGALGIWNGSNPLILNNTISKNSTQITSSIVLTSSSVPTFKNTIMYGNINGNGKEFYLGDNGCDPIIDHCNLEGGINALGGPGSGTNYTTGNYTNNIDSNPLFVAPSAAAGNGYNGLTADWSLQSTSPCIDAGDTTSISQYLPLVDLAGHTRLNGIIDMGAYEFPSSQGGFTLEGMVAYDNAAGTACAGVRVFRWSGVQVLDSTMSNGSGVFSFSNVAPGNYTLLCSSQQPWGGVNAADALLIMKHFVGMAMLSGLRLQAAELNGDDAVNSVDALLAMKRFVGITSSFAVVDWQFEVVQLTVQSNLQVNIKGICSGDTDGSHTP